MFWIFIKYLIIGKVCELGQGLQTGAELPDKNECDKSQVRVIDGSDADPIKKFRTRPFQFTW